MYWGLKKVYLRFLVRKPRSRAKLKSDIALFRKPACLASSRDMSEKISATAGQDEVVSTGRHKAHIEGDFVIRGRDNLLECLVMPAQPESQLELIARSFATSLTFVQLVGL